MSATPGFGLSRSTSAALEFPQLLSVIAGQGATDLGRKRLLETRPYMDPAALDAHRARFVELERLITVDGALVPSIEEAVEPRLAALAGRDGADGQDLVVLAAVLASSERARDRVLAADPPCPSLGERIATVPQTRELVRDIQTKLDGRGEVRDDASPALVRLRSQIHRARDRAYEALSGVADRVREHLGEDTIPLRAGRLVLVFKAGATGRIPGLAHGRSGTGKSVYFEPIEAVELNNGLQRAVEDEAAERQRILVELVERTRAALPAIRAQADLVAELDSLQAASRFRVVAEGTLADIGERHEVVLKEARHPLLDPRLATWRESTLGTAGHRGEVVPLGVELGPASRVLVVTGPNAGGKTVALKTVGLLQLLHQSGLPIPAGAGSRLPILDAVVATVGDEQDLLNDRSTFSGRLQRLREAWEIAGPDTLILLDELGSGTDPEEGAALSVALLEALCARGAAALITTHLLRVAAAAIDHDGAFCAAMAFEGATGRPTYRLHPGPPGGSEALALARRLGLPAAWLERAEALIGGEQRDLRLLLAEVEAGRKALESARVALDEEREDVERLRRRVAERERDLLAERKRLARSLQDELDTFRKKTRERLGTELEKLGSQLRTGGQRRARRESLAGEAVQRLFEDAPQLAPEETMAAPVRVGQPARHQRLRWQGTVEKLERGQAQVRVAGKVFRCPEGDLVGVAATDQPKPRSRRKVSVATSSDGGTQELVLIGERVEAAIERLDRVLDQALLAGSKTIRVVHGHGSGRLRRAVREHLRGHRGVSSHRAGGDGEGGDGATVVTLRG